MKRELPVRKNIRLKDYDYSKTGYYFITVCVEDKHELLGEIVGAASGRPQMQLSHSGKIAQTWIHKISVKYPHVCIQNHVVMPNHIHMIVSIQKTGRPDAAPTAGVGQMMGYFKYQTTKEIDIVGFWQRSYHDHIIRNEAEYKKIWEYIDNNPATWNQDCYYAK